MCRIQVTGLKEVNAVQKLLAVFKWLDPVARFALLVATAAQVATDISSKLFTGGFLFCCVVILILLDVVRLIIPAVQHYPIVLDITRIASMGLCLLLNANRESTFIQIYYFFLMGEIFHSQQGKRLKILISVHFTGFIVVWFCLHLAREQKSPEQYAASFFVLCAVYSLILFIFAVIHYFKREQERLRVLNTDLIEYSFEEHEYLLAKERSEISQELHDSIGHSLMATLMNVRYLKAIQDKDEAERKKQITEIEELLKECVANLRSSVYSLKELDENICLKDEIARIVQKFGELELIHIRVDYDDRVEAAPNYVKTVLFKTIREGITNSMRHGNADAVQLSIRFAEKHIEMIMKDNGRGCSDIQKSYGLNGIEDRVKKVGGEVCFISQKNKGFTIKTVLPGGNTE